MIGIPISGFLPAVQQGTIDEVLWEFEDRFIFEKACMDIERNIEIEKVLNFLRDTQRISSRQREMALRTAVLMYTVLQREGQIINPKYELPLVTPITKGELFREFRKDPANYHQNVMNSLLNGNEALHAYLSSQFSFEKAMFLSNITQRFSIFIYDALRRQEGKKGIGELERMHRQSQAPYRSYGITS